ncbi:efflux RND transporter periplasmic adaptor subunit [Clostridiaceae bacterium 35-E11]
MLKGSKKKTLIIGGIIVAIALAGAGAVKASKNQKNVGMQVQTVAIQKQDIESRIQTTGQIESMDKREIVSDVEEKIEKVFVQKGDRVEKDQVLMKLEETNIRYKIKEAETRLAIEQNTMNQLKTDLEIALNNAEIKYKDAKDTYERNKQLYEEHVISKNELDQSKSTLDEMQNDSLSAKKKLGDEENAGQVAKQAKQVQLAELEVEKLKDNLEKHTIKSPITGTIVDMKIAESGIVESHVTLMFIQDVDHLEIVTNINEYDASKIKMGDAVEITGDAFEGKTYHGKIKYIGEIAKTVETGQGKENVIEVKVEIQDIDKSLKPGLSAKLDILTESKKDVLVLPYETIFTKKNGEKVVFIVENGKAKEHKITTGIESDLTVEVIGKGLKEKDRVIVNPTENVKDGDEVHENKVM